MDNSILKSALKELGLDNLSINLYLELMKSEKKLGVSDLASIFGVYRQKIYNALDQLNNTNLLVKNPQYSRHIEIKSPAIVYSLLKEKQYEINKTSTTLKESLPEILNSFNAPGRQPTVRIFDGTNKFIFLLTTILDELSQNDEILSFNEGRDFYKVVDFSYFFNVWIEKRVSKKIPIKILLNPQAQIPELEFKQNLQKSREVKILPDEYQSQGCYWVIGTKLILWDTQSPKAILIDNFTISELHRQQFMLLWSLL